MASRIIINFYNEILHPPLINIRGGCNISSNASEARKFPATISHVILLRGPGTISQLEKNFLTRPLYQTGTNGALITHTDSYTTLSSAVTLNLHTIIILCCSNCQKY